MPRRRFQLKNLIAGLLVASAFLLQAVEVSAALSRSQARNLLRRAAGFELSGGAVRVRSVNDTSANSAEIKADVRTAFRFQSDANGRWRIAEIRTGQDRWENIELIARALGSSGQSDECTSPDPPLRGSAALDPSNKRARCLLGSLFGLPVPSDAIRIQQVAPLSVPFSSESSAVVVAWFAVDARAVRDKSGWRIAEVRTGSHDWLLVEPLVAAVNQVKLSRAREQLQTMSEALQKYRTDRGGYVVAENQAVMIDHLSPKYLQPVLRLDPWGTPYTYQGTRDRFTLASLGADRKPNTGDELSISSP